ncbi:MAG: hypothetical protein AAFV25_24325 [Bacteroidota bacterium]
MKAKLQKIQEDPLSIKKLSFSEAYDMERLPDGVAQCTNLEKIDLSYSGIKEIPDYLLALPHLRSLDLLACTHLKKLPKAFWSSQQWKDLALDCHSEADVEKVCQMTGLTSLCIGGRVDRLSPKIARLENLQQLELLGTKIKDLPEELSQLSRLKKVVLSQMLFGMEKGVRLRLDALFKTLSRCLKLQQLDLSQNEISRIPASIGSLGGLRKLSLHSNCLSSLPAEMFALTQLRELDVGINQLHSIPAGIEKLQHLKTLKLHSNWQNKIDLTPLWAVVGELKNLQRLELWSCQSVQQLPETIADCPKLKHLDVDNNLLRSLPDSLQRMTQLTYLRLSTNQIPPPVIEALKHHLPKTKILG